MSTPKKLVTVFGATGVQGGSVIKSILADPKASSQFAIRGITRNANKPAAKALAEKGVEVVAADMDDPTSLSAALKGSYAVFAVTNYWEKMDAQDEEKQGRTLADLAKEHGVQHYIWSTLSNITKTSNGRLSKVYHFDSKARVDEHIEELGIPATYFLAGVYMSNFPGQDIRRNPEAGVYELGLPVPTDTKMPMLATEFDTGKFVKAILLNREKTLGKRIFGAEGYYSVSELMDIFAQVKPVDGKGARAVTISDEAYKAELAAAGMPPFGPKDPTAGSMPLYVQEELVQNWKLNDPSAGGPGYYGGLGLEESQSILDEKLVTWKEYLERSPELKDLK
ncbi:related to nitrogen metabolic regulation protein nmr [Cephalotrichum gorgonifer]|uniref:Related to nitrogen metabolic regulation protein nmr n=1 Tax=Cephalotrichum gorgonifer TaxID=2041049 RepID=A0AAE8N6B3_9PEZI|nr:related to nitrogen metabolic regulation protein nmr [Cephalotrichum gorgonifer]